MATKRRTKSSNIKPQVNDTNAPEGQPEALKDDLELEAQLNDKTFTCKTDNVEDAIKQLGDNNPKVKTRLILKIKKGNKEYNKIIFVPRVRRLFKNDMFRRIFSNGINRFFKF